MAISTTSTYRPNADKVVKNGLRLAGMLNASHTPKAEQYSMGREFLLEGMLALQAEGVFIRTRELYEQELTAGIASYTAPAGTLDIEDGAVVRDTNDLDGPASIMTQDEYNQLSDKTTSGRPTQYYPKETESGFTLYLYPVPDSSWTTIIYPRIRLVRDLDTGNLDLDCPTKWIQAFEFMLAWKFCLHYRRPMEMIGLYGDYWEKEKQKILHDETPRGPLTFVLEPLFSR